MMPQQHAACRMMPGPGHRGGAWRVIRRLRSPAPMSMSMGAAGLSRSWILRTLQTAEIQLSTFCMGKNTKKKM